MKKITIAIVEDEIIVAYDIKGLLEEMGYECLDPCSDFAEALEMLTLHRPDIAILDINLGGKKDGVDVAKFIRAGTDIPLIFLTANSDASTVARAREVLPDAYLIKPFHKAHLYTAIEMAIFAHEKKKADAAVSRQVGQPLKDVLFVKEGQYFHRVAYDDIVFLSANQNYVTIHTAVKNFLVRTTMQDYMEQIDQTRIVRVHRSYAVNLNKVEKINTVSLVVGSHEVPMSKNYAEDLLKLFNIQ